MFQAAARAFDAAGIGAFDGPYSLAPFQRARAKTFDLADLDLVVDLGSDIGSKLWWRGLATVSVLVFVTAKLGFTIPALPSDVPPPLLPIQVELAQASTIAPLAYGGVTGVETPATSKVVRLAEPPERPRVEVQASLRAVDSVEGALRRAGVGSADIRTAADLIASSVNLKSLKPGTDFDLVLGRRADKSMPRPLDHLAFRAAFDLKLEVVRAAPGEPLALKRIPIAVDNTPLRVTGTVGSSLYKAARNSGLPGRVVADAIKALSYRIDIQRDVTGRDRFDIVVAHRRAETGETETGELLFVGLDGRKDIELLRWKASGRSQFFTADGASAKKGLMKTPVDGARMSSGFGFRIHPILGYSRLHKGVDFAAGHGAPIMAAASGRVNFAGRHGGHGNYVRIDHGKGMATAYAHMSRFKVSNGAHVEQGQVIGYVGSTGMSTGPHLHYEVYRNGKAVDPRSAKFAGGVQLAGSELSRFRSEMSRLKRVAPAGAGADQIANVEKKDEKRG